MPGMMLDFSPNGSCGIMLSRGEKTRIHCQGGSYLET